jgi:hypothetical protein
VTGFAPEVEHLPVCPHRALPIPYVAERDAAGVAQFTILDQDRQEECWKGRLCAMCGLPMGEEVAFLGDEVSTRPGSFWIEPPVHERCAELAIGGLCPFVSRQRVPRRPPDDDVALVGVGPDELAEIGRAVAKRPWVMAIVRKYGRALELGHTGSPVIVYTARRVERVRRYRWEGGRAAEVIHRPAPMMVRAQPRRTSRAARKRGGAR